MTYDSIKELVEGKSLPLAGVNEIGELVSISGGQNDIGKYYHTMTSQDNGWLRHNYYYDDGSWEELYER